MTVLIVMLLLAGVLVVTGQLALSARKSGVDQEATIRAQYVAESGVARGQARLRQARSILSTVAIAQNGTTQASLKALFAQFCTVRSWFRERLGDYHWNPGGSSHTLHSKHGCRRDQHRWRRPQFQHRVAQRRQWEYCLPGGLDGCHLACAV